MDIRPFYVFIACLDCRLSSELLGGDCGGFVDFNRCLRAIVFPSFNLFSGAWASALGGFFDPWESPRFDILAKVSVEHLRVGILVYSAHDSLYLPLCRIVAIFDQEFSQGWLVDPRSIHSARIRAHNRGEASISTEIEPLLQYLSHLLAHLYELNLFRQEDSNPFFDLKREEGLLVGALTLT